MMGRPEILFPLFASLDSLPGIGPKLVRVLGQMEIGKPRDLLFTLPSSGVDRRIRPTVKDAALPTTVTTEVTVLRHLPSQAKGRPYRVRVSDSEVEFPLVFFHARSDWLQRRLPEGERRVVSGRAELFDGAVQMVHPDYILAPEEARQLPKFEPVYPLTQGLVQGVMAKAMAAAVERAPELDDWLEPAFLESMGWPRWHDAVTRVHAPDSAKDINPDAPARQRLAYDEFLAHQVTLALARSLRKRRKGRSTTATGHLQAKAIEALPYRPTGAQVRATREICEDLAASERMNRLLQGDVGSGKTFVAFMSLLAAVEVGGQGALMAPTEILARQHLEALRPMAEAAHVVLELLTGRDKGKERAAKLAALKNGEIQILLGTHAVFQEDVAFRDLRVAVIDEQHRFGVAQRMELGKKGDTVDVLVMTATPIPRSLSLTRFGDMDMSVLDEKPPGRNPVTTAAVPHGRIGRVETQLKAAVENGRQAYWVCPLVGESDSHPQTAAEERFLRLRTVLGKQAVGLVHGQLPSGERDAAMAAFVSGDTRVLVATTVIEVGVDVPNASIMVIEGAESFGLSQLHQMRGRVGRGAERSACLLLYRSPLSDSARRRIEILRATEDGFRIAEEDLAMRGAGDVLGTAQSGLPRFRIADWESHGSLLSVANRDAGELVARDPELKTRRGEAVRTLLWLLEQDKAITMISVG
ncbi:MAG: ATP-dependent DNA helicase RecG [Boseongicola sp. SB0662_bin_57]|nr:ATP-dependent DNA helicase RecG [Boseongicola sp. SB0662_bin_57]